MITYFVSSNDHKHKDVARIFHDSAHPPRSLYANLVEVLSFDQNTVIREKAKAAYQRHKIPVIVEHGALYINYFKDLPGPMVKFFWEKLQDGLSSAIPPGASRDAYAIQMVCFCDGKRLRVYEGRAEGAIAPKAKGTGGIHWEPMFIPRGHTKTFGEMRVDERIAVHPVKLAFDALRRDLHI